jgi:HSP20 family protein
MPRHPDPLKELLDLQERMNRLFDQTLGDESGEDLASLPNGWSPAADVYATAEGYTLEIELPGLDRDGIEIQVEGRELFVRGERHPMGGRSATYHRLERHYGPFGRSFRFDADIDADGIEAEVEDGVLKLTVPKARAARGSRRVPVTRS